MTKLSQTEIDRLKNRPHNTKLWLSIYQPKTILSAQVNDSGAAKGDRVITYDGASGDYTQIKNGMTLYVGSSAGLSDKGIVRVRSASSTQLTLAENSHIVWEDDDYLTVVAFFEINAVYPRIIQDPSNPLRTLWYKDYDIEYTNQNSVLGSFICMGGHYAGFIEPDDDKCWVYYSSSGTYSLVGGTLTYQWDFQSGTALSSSGTTSADPGWVSYSNPGHYTTSLTVSGSVGGVDTSYRHISIYDRPENGTSNPILKWELLDLSGDREGGGYSATIRIRQNVPENTIRDGALVVIFADDWYEYEKVSIGGNQETREKIVFAGYILNGSIRYNYAYSAVEFEVGSPTLVMQESECFAISITDCNDPVTTYNANRATYPTPWVLVADLGVARGIYHYLRWHSTVMQCADIHFLPDDRAIYAQDFDRTSLYDAVNTLINSALLGRCVSDRQGSLWFEQDIYVYPPAYATGTNFYITKQDWMDEPLIEERQTDEISYIEIGGVVYTQALETSIPKLAAIPGVAPGYRGGVERIQGLALLDQNELNRLGGYLYTYKNNRYPDINVKLAGNYRNADIAPQEKWHFLVSQGDTQRQISVDIQTFVKNVGFVYDPTKEVLLTNVGLSELSTELIGDTLVIPVEPPDPEPPVEPEPPDPPEPPPTGTTPPTGTVTYYGMAFLAVNNFTSGSSVAGLYKSESFDPSTGTAVVWDHVWDYNSYVTSHALLEMALDDNDPGNYIFFSTANNNGEIWRWTPGGGGELVLTAADANTLCGTSGRSLRSVCVDDSTGYVYTLLAASWQTSYLLRSTNHGDGWTNLASFVGGIGNSGLAARGSYIWRGSSDLGVELLNCSTNNGSTWATAIVSGAGANPTIRIDPTNPAVCWAAASDATLKKCTYSGGSISIETKNSAGVSTLTTNGIDGVWINPGGASHQRALVGTKIYETFNEWASISSSGTVNAELVFGGQMCQQAWSADYVWTACVRSDVNTVSVYAADATIGPYSNKDGANQNTPPYTDAIPNVARDVPLFGFWAGEAV